MPGPSLIPAHGTNPYDAQFKLLWNRSHFDDGTEITGVINVQNPVYGAVGDGTGDQGPAIKAAVQAAWSASPRQSVYVPAGNYRVVTPIDMSTLTLGSDLVGWSFICDPGATFTDASAGTVLSLNLPSGRQAVACQARVGTILGAGAGVGTDNGLFLLGWSDSFIDVGWVNGFGGVGFLVGASSSIGTFNNLIRVGRLSACLNGFETLGIAGVWGFQGNTVQFGQVTSNTNGVVVDSNGTGLNSVLNHFILGPVENNSGVGILDNNGQNWWDVANTNGNAAGFDLGAGAARVPVVRGFFSDGVSPNSQLIDVVNYATAPGSVGPPSVPASTVTQANLYDRPADVYVNGGTVTVIKVGGVATGAITGSFRLLPGETISITYTGAPTWTWFLV